MCINIYFLLENVCNRTSKLSRDFIFVDLEMSTVTVFYRGYFPNISYCAPSSFKIIEKKTVKKVTNLLAGLM